MMAGWTISGPEDPLEHSTMEIAFSMRRTLSGFATSK